MLGGVLINNILSLNIPINFITLFWNNSYSHILKIKVYARTWPFWTFKKILFSLRKKSYLFDDSLSTWLKENCRRSSFKVGERAALDYAWENVRMALLCFSVWFLRKDSTKYHLWEWLRWGYVYSVRSTALNHML